MLLPRSLTARLTMLFALVTTCVLLLLGGIVGILVDKHFVELDRSMLEGKYVFVRSMLESVNTESELKALPQRLQDSLVGHEGFVLGIWVQHGQAIFRSKENAFPDSWEATRTNIPLEAWTNPDGVSFRGFARVSSTNMGAQPALVVALATNLDHHEHFMQEFRQALWGIVALVALLAGLLGWAVARSGLAPLREMARHAASITATKLDKRLPEKPLPSELSEVGQTLNAMLKRLEEAFRRLSDFSSDIAHELRTPVNALLVQNQVTLSKARTIEEYQDVLVSNIEELERLSRMVSDMLFLAKADNALLIPNHEEVALATEARDVLDFYEAIAEEKNLHLACRGEGSMRGDRLMLRRALNNLVSNAVRHTPENGRVWIEIGQREAGVVDLSVHNTGEPIPDSLLPRLFDRFYRADSSRQRFTDGTGLGLSITQSIAKAHGGNLSVTSTANVTVFTLSFPEMMGTGV